MSQAHKARKFSTNFGATDPKRPITILPIGRESIVISKKTFCVTGGSIGIGSMRGCRALSSGTSSFPLHNLCETTRKRRQVIRFMMAAKLNDTLRRCSLLWSTTRKHYDAGCLLKNISRRHTMTKQALLLKHKYGYCIHRELLT
jgi:hypothetical protein